MCEHSQSGQTPWFRWPSQNGKNRALVYKWSISGWWQWDTNQVWFSLTNERCWEYYRNMSYLGWWLILRWRGDNWTNPWEWGFLSYMDLFPYFLDQKAVRRIIKSSFDLHISQEFPPQYTLITHLWSCDTCHGRTWKCAVLTSLQILVVKLLKELPVGKFKPPAPLGATCVHWPIQGGA